jgi:S1-C subfamily serine protease
MYTVSICRDESGTFGWEIEDDCYVAAITPAGPAALAGIEVGSFISAVNGIQVGSKADIVAVLGKTKPTDEISFELEEGLHEGEGAGPN